jgi:transcriptional regulator with XRE-family HTH domain
VKEKIESGHTNFSEYLRRLRESKNLSVRQAAKQAGISSAYLSQVEGGKRGKRKSTEDHFAPHPQILKKIADVYHVSARQLFEQAGYLDNDKANIYGFSEQNELDRIFDFVIHDPALNQIFTSLDKRAIVNRYEALTRKRLITWAGETDTHPSVKKSEFSELRCENGNLYAETPHTSLTLKEVAQELECEEKDVEKMIQFGQLSAKKNDFNEWMIEKIELQKFKNGAVHYWIHHNATKIPVAKTPTTLEEQNQFFEQLEDLRFGNSEHIEPVVSTVEPLPKKKKHRK